MNQNYTMTRVNDPEPYYLVTGCLDRNQTEIRGDHYFGSYYVDRAVPFLEELPVVLLTPCYLGDVVPTCIGFTREQDDQSYLGDGVLNLYLTVKFRPNGRQFLYTEEDIGRLVIGVYMPI